MAARRSGFRRYAEGFPGIEGILRKIEGILPKYPLDLLQCPADLPSYLTGFPNYPIDLLFIRADPVWLQSDLFRYRADARHYPAVGSSIQGKAKSEGAYHLL